MHVYRDVGGFRVGSSIEMDKGKGGREEGLGCLHVEARESIWTDLLCFFIGLVESGKDEAVRQVH